jgi:purine-binding chemotaxis protein CheW
VGIQAVTPVPHTPGFILGVINLRGKVIPVMDLKVKFGMDAAKATPESCIVVVKVNSLDFGILVDKVSEVAEIAPENIEPVPALAANIDTSFILGLGKAQNKVKILLDIARILSSEEIDTVNSLVA